MIVNATGVFKGVYNDLKLSWLPFRVKYTCTNTVGQPAFVIIHKTNYELVVF